jgi:hypothetical protein
MKKVLLGFLGLALSASLAAADVPDPAFCEVQPSDALNGSVLCPQSPFPIPSSINTITVRNSSNVPIPNASVVWQFTALNNICPTTVLTGNTNGIGELTLTLGGGGCAHNVPSASVVKANGVTIRAYSNAKSPDYDGASGDGVVNLADLIKFSNEFLGVDPSECHDYDNNGDTNLGDLIIFSTPFVNSNSCP